MLSLVLGFLTSIAPLITSAGLGLINLFVQNKAEKEQAMKDFTDAIASHAHDALLSVNARFNDKKQDDELNQMAKDLDAPPPPPPPKQ